MKIRTVVVGPIETNCYIVEQDGEAIVVDPGDDAPRILAALGDTPVKEVVCTHCHWDHIAALPALVEATGAAVSAGAADAPYVEQPGARTARNLPGYVGPQEVRRLAEGDEVAVGSRTFAVIETPGHTPGCICLHCAEEGVLFAGDTVFAGGRFGRTDFEGGSMQEMKSSLAKIARLVPDDTVVYSGHERSSTMERERRLNPYMR